MGAGDVWPRSRGQQQAPRVEPPPRPAVPPAPPPPPGGVPPCADECGRSPRCRHYGLCRLADALLDRTKGRRL